MTNKCELLINIVMKEQAKDADRLEPKWCTVGYLCDFWGYTDTITVGGEAGSNLLRYSGETW
ncbi:hypothetical protein AIR33_08895 [Salmonella enterica]|nr:hypothetical protein [Salmonella enterica]EEJ9027509.1 hypothetical protein [Salmonella enterica subsp. enterica]